jgi:hypothetical protein
MFSGKVILRQTTYFLILSKHQLDLKLLSELRLIFQGEATHDGLDLSSI